MISQNAPRPAVTADTVAMAGNPGARWILLVRRGKPPFEGMWALPGGFLDEGEEPEHAARRELNEETSLTADLPFVLVGVYGERGRDPRGWTVSVAYAVDTGPEPVDVRGGDDAAEARWHPVATLPDLAFDHARIVADALECLGE